MMGLLTLHNTDALAGVVLPPKPLYQPYINFPSPQVLMWLFYGSITPPVSTHHIRLNTPPPQQQPPLHVLTPKIHNSHQSPRPRRFIPFIQDKIGELLILIASHCLHNGFFQTCVNIHVRLNIIPLAPALHSTATLINQLGNHGAPVSTFSPLSPTGLHQVLSCVSHILDSQDPKLIQG